MLLRDHYKNVWNNYSDLFCDTPANLPTRPLDGVWCVMPQKPQNHLIMCILGVKTPTVKPGSYNTVELAKEAVILGEYKDIRPTQ